MLIETTRPHKWAISIITVVINVGRGRCSRSIYFHLLVSSPTTLSLNWDHSVRERTPENSRNFHHSAERRWRRAAMLCAIDYAPCRVWSRCLLSISVWSAKLKGERVRSLWLTYHNHTTTTRYQRPDGCVSVKDTHHGLWAEQPPSNMTHYVRVRAFCCVTSHTTETPKTICRNLSVYGYEAWRRRVKCCCEQTNLTLPGSDIAGLHEDDTSTSFNRSRDYLANEFCSDSGKSVFNSSDYSTLTLIPSLGWEAIRSRWKFNPKIREVWYG